MKKHRIAILYKITEGPWGGGNSFLRSLSKVWGDMGIEVTNRLDVNVTGALLNSNFLGPGKKFTPAVAKRLVRTGRQGLFDRLFPLWREKRPPFIHRLDGVFKYYGRENVSDDINQRDINHHVDWTIYQSNYCRESFDSIGADVTNSTVIYNGVDLNVFYPSESISPSTPFRLLAIAWSPNINKGFPEMVEAAKIPGVEVNFYGNWTRELEPGKVNVHSPVEHARLSEVMRSNHALLHMAKNDPCSNAILEGMASGLPMVYHPSGGSPEIACGCGLPGDKNLVAAIEELRDRYNELRSRVLEHRNEISIEKTAEKYIEVFDRVGPKEIA